MSTGFGRPSSISDLHSQINHGEPRAYQLDVTGKGAKLPGHPRMDGLVPESTPTQTQRKDDSQTPPDRRHRSPIHPPPHRTTGHHPDKCNTLLNHIYEKRHQPKSRRRTYIAAGHTSPMDLWTTRIPSLKVRHSSDTDQSHHRRTLPRRPNPSDSHDAIAATNTEPRTSERRYPRPRSELTRLLRP